MRQLTNDHAIIRVQSVLGFFDYFLVEMIKRDGLFEIKVHHDEDIEKLKQKCNQLTIDFQNKFMRAYTLPNANLRKRWYVIPRNQKVLVSRMF